VAIRKERGIGPRQGKLKLKLVGKKTEEKRDTENARRRELGPNPTKFCKGKGTIKMVSNPPGMGGKKTREGVEPKQTTRGDNKGGRRTAKVKTGRVGER